MKTWLSILILLSAMAARGQNSLSDPQFLANLNLKSLAAPFTTNTVPGLFLWLKADGLNGQTNASNGDVTNWIDSFTGVKWSSATTNYGVVTNINGNTAVFFAKSRTAASGMLGQPDTGASNDFTFFFVFNQLVTNSALLLAWSQLGTGDMFCYQNWCAWYWGAPWGVNFGTTFGTSNVTQIRTWVLKSTNSVAIYTNGVAMSGLTNTTFAKKTFSSGGGSVRLFQNFDGTTGYFKGTVAEVMGYLGGLSDADRKKVHSYLAAKYALPDP